MSRVTIKNPKHPLGPDSAAAARRAGLKTVIDKDGHLAAVCDATDDEIATARRAGLVVEHVTTRHRSVPTFPEVVSTYWDAA